MSYTIKNLRDVEDVAARFGSDGSQELRFATGALEAQDTGFTHLTVKPGQRSQAHKHELAEEVYVVLSGSGRVKLDGDTVELRPLDAVRVAPPVGRSFEAGPDGLELLAFGPHRTGDGELLTEEFWTS